VRLHTLRRPYPVACKPDLTPALPREYSSCTQQDVHSVAQSQYDAAIEVEISNLLIGECEKEMILARLRRGIHPETHEPQATHDVEHQQHKHLAEGYAAVSSNVKRAHEIIQIRQRQRSRDEEEEFERWLHAERAQKPALLQPRQPVPVVKQSKLRSNYPLMIRIPSRDEYDTVRPKTDERTFESKPFDENTLYDKSVELGDFTLRLEDTFGVEKEPKRDNDDDTFEKIYAAITLESSVELNAYSSSWSKRVDPPTKPDPETIVEHYQRGRTSIEQGSNSVFRSQQTTDNTDIVSSRLKTRTESRSCIRSTSRNQRADSQRNRSASRTHREHSIQRTPTMQSTVTSPSGNISSPRSHQSPSRGISRSRRSRSRSTSIAPHMIDDQHNANLFRGAALIREQLLRSMSSADEAMEQAEREDERLKQLQDDYRATCRISREAQSSDKNESQIQSKISTPSRSSNARYAASLTSTPNSHDSSTFESESRRLDNIIGMFASNGSSTGSNELKIDVISPTSSLGLSSPMSQAMSCTNDNAQSPMQNITRSKNTDGRSFFQEGDEDVAISIEMTQTLEQTHGMQHTMEVDEALAHAQQAGPFWRSLVGNHVRFPSSWISFLPPTSPPIYSQNFFKWSKWYYVARHRVQGDKRLNSREFGVRSRSSGGRILMRMVIREVQTQQVCREIAIGCFHPNSKGIRKGDPSPEAEDVREVWMAVRWLMDIDDNEPKIDLRDEGVVDNFLMQKKKTLDPFTMGSTLGHRKAVNNENVRAVSMKYCLTLSLFFDQITDMFLLSTIWYLPCIDRFLAIKHLYQP